MNKLSVLIVDDDYAVGGMLRRLFGFEGFEVQIAPDGRAALEYLNLQRPDLLLLDYNLPGKNGLDLLADFQTLHPNLNVILITGTEDPDLVARASQAGIGFLSKPLAVHELLTRARTLTG